MTSNELPCPIWENPPAAQDIAEVGRLCDYPRAGGRFVLMQDGAACLHRLSDGQKANLSHWIYKHNLAYRLFDESPGLGEAPPVLDQKWVENNRDRTPPASDRILTFLREVIRSDDAGEHHKRDSELEADLRMAAGGCRDRKDLSELYRYANAQDWMGAPFGMRRPAIPNAIDPKIINLAARIHVEEQLGEQGRGRQGFVAMWFDDSMLEAYERGIEPAIGDAGYEPVRIDRQEFLGKVDDEIVAEIRKSRFVVADFTASKKAGARGGVYYEAGFAQGLGIDVIHTCRRDRMQAVHFDTNHFNHITWETPEDLRTKLHRRIEATLGRGPGDPPTEGRGGVR